MPKLLQINVCSNWGSTGKIAEQIGLCAQAHGWESYVAYGRASNPSQNKLIKVGSKLDVYEHYAENRIFDNDGLASRWSTKKLVKTIAELKPDIIHLHNIHDHFLNYRILFEFFNSINTPVVWTLHDCWNFTGGCAYFDSVDCMRWKSGCGQCPLRKNKFVDRSQMHYQLRKNLFGSKNLVLVPVSNWIGGFLSESFLKDKPVKVIHNGIDISRFKPFDNSRVNEKYGLADKFVVIGVALPWSARKGLDDFKKMAERLDDSFRIILVGLSDEQMKSLPEKVIGIKRTSNVTELAELYSAADVFVNSTYSDNFPTTNLEALACGTPVITYRTGGSPEAIDENTGAVVEQGNLGALCEKIKDFKSTDFKKNHSAACRKRAEECFDKDKCFEKYIELYEQILANK